MFLSLIGCVPGPSNTVKNDFIVMYDVQIYDAGHLIRRYPDCTDVFNKSNVSSVFILYSKSKGRIEVSGTVIVEPYRVPVELEKE